MPVAVITGASRGLGAALASALLDRGWRLVVDARHGDRLREAFPDADPTQVRAIPGDVTDPDHRSDLVAAAEALGGADALVNNASTLGPSPLPALAELPVEQLSSILTTNLLAPLALVQGFLPQLDHKAGRVVNVTSDAGVEAYPGWGGYGASKAALDQASAVLAVENPGLRVYALDPGDMRTQMHQKAYPGEDISDRPEPGTVVPAFLELVTGDHPSGRYRAGDLPTGTTRVSA